MDANLKTFIYFGVGALALLALADKLPRAAIMLMIILIAGVLLTHWQDYVDYLSIPGTSKTSSVKTVGASKSPLPGKPSSVPMPWLQ